MTFDKWCREYAPKAPEYLDDCARDAWNAALDAAKKTTVRGLIDASDKEKTAHYTACKNIAEAMDALKVGDGGTATRNAIAQGRPE